MEGKPAYSEVFPGAVTQVARRVASFGKPIYITENGLSDPDDRLRPWQLASAVKAMHAAIAGGVDLRGYYHWTLVDNFEWAEGWHMRFGLVALDERTQQRTPRPSAALYGAIAHANALTPAMVREFARSSVDELFPSL
jgi:beta-glucosidase